VATLSIAFTNVVEASKVRSPTRQQQVADALEDDTRVVSNTQLEQQLAGQPKDVQARSESRCWLRSSPDSSDFSTHSG
jgi:hypothetical protein